jgi:uncharacterized membrane protein
MEKHLSIKDTIVYGFTTFFSRFWYLLGIMCLGILLYGVGLLLCGMCYALIKTMLFFFGPRSEAVSTLLGDTAVWLLAIFLNAFFLTYAWKTALMIYDEGVYGITLKKIFATIPSKRVIKFIGCAILEWLIVSVGLLLLIVPGIYLATKLQFSLLYIVDTDCGILEALKKSYRITTGNFWRVFCIEFLSSLLWGTVILIPVGLLMQVYAYRWLRANKAEEVA